MSWKSPMMMSSIQISIQSSFLVRLLRVQLPLYSSPSSLRRLGNQQAISQSQVVMSVVIYCLSCRKSLRSRSGGRPQGKGGSQIVINQCDSFTRLVCVCVCVRKSRSLMGRLIVLVGTRRFCAVGVVEHRLVRPWGRCCAVGARTETERCGGGRSWLPSPWRARCSLRFG
jgi:hypothetical protein